MSATNRPPQKKPGAKLKRADYAQPRPVRFPLDEDKRLEVAAQRLGVSVAQLIRICVRVVNPATLPPEMCDLTAHLRQHLKGGVGA